MSHIKKKKGSRYNGKKKWKQITIFSCLFSLLHQKKAARIKVSGNSPGIEEALEDVKAVKKTTNYFFCISVHHSLSLQVRSLRNSLKSSCQEQGDIKKMIKWTVKFHQIQLIKGFRSESPDILRIWSVTYFLSKPCYQRNRLCQVVFRSVLGWSEEIQMNTSVHHMRKLLRKLRHGMVLTNVWENMLGIGSWCGGRRAAQGCKNTLEPINKWLQVTSVKIFATFLTDSFI